MFECNSNANSDPPTHQTSPSNHLSSITDHDQNFSYPYLSFPSHLLDDDELFLGTILSYPSPPLPPPPFSPPPPPPTSEDSASGATGGKQMAKEKGKRKRAIAPPSKVAASGSGCGGGAAGKQKRRRGKTDRHSKIHTAKGPRDRRMRLSLQIARKFFDLQDMLGFDKASKTIEWLFNKSKAAIKDLTERSCTGLTSSPSDQDINGGGVSGDDDNNSGDDNRPKGKKGAVLFQAMRENREKARARARERTKEKLLVMQKQGKEQNPNCSSAIIRGDQIMGQSQYGLEDNEQHQLPLEDQMASIGIVEKYLTTSSSTLFDFHHDTHDDQHLPGIPCDPVMGSNEINFAGFPANWATQNMGMSSNHTGSQNPNCAFMGRPYSQGN